MTRQEMRLEISGALLARNTLLNLLGQAVPLLVGIATIPFIIHGLGTERFGLLALAWVVAGYFTVFDLGLGRTVTKYAAEALGRGGREKVPGILWTAVAAQAVTGLAGALALAGATPFLVERVLSIPPALAGEARATFYLLAPSVPIVFVSASLSGVLEAAQRFDLVNAVRAPSSALTFLLPVAGLALGLDLPGIVAMIVLGRLAALGTLVLLGFRVFPGLREFSCHRSLLPRLLAFGGWVTLSSVVSPVLVYLDRLLVASLLSVAALAYYAAPYEMATRLWIVPVSLVMAIFPAFSALEGRGDRQYLAALFTRSVKYVLLALGPVALGLALFAEAILRAWLGEEFAAQGAPVLQILALGVLVNSLAQIPYALLHGAGRPDLPAKFHLAQLPFYAGVAWVLIGHFGIAGAAAAWTVRVAVDALLLFLAAGKVFALSGRLLAANGVTLTGLVLFLLAGAAYGLSSLMDTHPLAVRSGAFAALLGAFAWVSWKTLLDASDRAAVAAAAGRLRTREDRW